MGAIPSDYVVTWLGGTGLLMVFQWAAVFAATVVCLSLIVVFWKRSLQL